MTDDREAAGQATGVEDWVMRDVRLRARRGRYRSRILRRLVRHMFGAFLFYLPARRKDPAPTTARWIATCTPLVLRAQAVRRIYCVEGTLWITAGDGADHVLRSGEALALEAAEDVIISAIKGPACIRLQAPHAGLTPSWPAMRGWFLSSGAVRSR